MDEKLAMDAVKHLKQLGVKDVFISDWRGNSIDFASANKAGTLPLTESKLNGEEK